MFKRALRKAINIFKKWLDDNKPVIKEKDPQDCEFAWQFLNSIYSQLMAENSNILRSNYTWAMIQTAHLASTIGINRISAIEFGVAGGNGLIALKRVSEKLEGIFNIGIDVYGFDSGCGLPKPNDYRDLPNLWSEGDYPMDIQKLQQKLHGAHLIIGLVKDTVPKFIDSNPAPIGFISFDLDHYSSTVQAFRVLKADHVMLMPRIYCYFDDILGFTYGHHNGERLAISEFNIKNRLRQISKIYGLRFYLPKQVFNANWSEKMYMAHIVDHNLYNERDGLVVEARMDLRTK